MAWGALGLFVDFLLIYRDAGIGADDGARGATYTLVCHVATKGVTFVVHFAYGERQRLCGTGHDAEVAPLAAGFVNDDGSNNFAHLFF